ncbi:MAG: cobamide remodeling phosphodiesterase CbiR [Desulfobacterales bacterium]|nr:cobamide remodeling phosphodiesterase CbiR [Desulfobacterales bacterium]
MTSFQPLDRPFKGVYPFRLATTSFIYSADWCTNVRLLGPFVDEVELLFLESRYDGCFPSTREIHWLSSLAEQYTLTYNVHLPTDISLCHTSPSERKKAIEILYHVIDFSAALTPSTWTLHLPFEPDSVSIDSIQDWRACCRDGLERLINRSGVSPKKLSIETLFYPFEWIGDIVKDFHLGVCIDTGHLMLKNADPLAVYAAYDDIVSILHLHGVHEQKDHVSLDKLSTKRSEKILSLLKRYTGTVSIEVFSFNDLRTSLSWLSHHWQQNPFQR